MSRPVTVIRPSKGPGELQLSRLWEQKRLIFFFAWKDLSIRYRNTSLGVLWALFQPLVTAVLFTLLVGRHAQHLLHGNDYISFALTGLLPWVLISQVVIHSANILSSYEPVIKKSNFDRLTLPLSLIIVFSLDFSFLLLLCLIVLPLKGSGISSSISLLPIAITYLLTLSTALACWISALNTLFRDLRVVTPFFVQIGMFSAPIVYPLAFIPERYWDIFAINPLVGAVELFRYSLLPESTLHLPSIVTGSIITFLLLLSGILFFRWNERNLFENL